MLYTARNIEGLPYQTLNRLLTVTLEHGKIHLSNKAIMHIHERHLHDAPYCLAHLDKVITHPEIAGKSPSHPDNFVLVKKIEERFLLVAVSEVKNVNGNYPLLSSYFIDEDGVARRIRKGFFIKI